MGNEKLKILAIYLELIDISLDLLLKILKLFVCNL